MTLILHRYQETKEYMQTTCYRVLTYPDPRLRVKAAPVEKIDDKVCEIVKQMIPILYEENGAGLAATQLGINKRIVLIDLSEDRKALQVLINPEIVEMAGEQEQPEGCLSVPGVYAAVKRPMFVRAKALNLEGKEVILEGSEFMAACIHHEIDHLNGVLYIDHLSNLKRQLLIKKMEKYLRQRM